MDGFNFEFADGIPDCDPCLYARSPMYSGSEVMTSRLHESQSNWGRNNEGDTQSKGFRSDLPTKSSQSDEGSNFYSIEGPDSAPRSAGGDGNPRGTRPHETTEKNNNKSAVYAVTEAQVHHSGATADALPSGPRDKDVIDGCLEAPGVAGCGQCETSGSTSLAAKCKRQVFANARTFSKDVSSCSSSSGQQPESSSGPEQPSCLSESSEKDCPAMPASCLKDSDVACEDAHGASQTGASRGRCPSSSSGVRFGLDSPSSPERSTESSRPTFMLSFGSVGMSAEENQVRSTDNLCSITSPARDFSTADSGAERDKRPNGRPEADTQQNGKHTITMRISKSLGTFFQKSPSKSSVIADMTDVQDTCPEQSPGKSTTIKEPRRQTSLAGRMATSLAKLGRRGVFKGTSAEAEDEGELYNNNKYMPVFVSPLDQVDVTDKDPVPLTDEQGKLLKESWITIKRHVTEVGVETFMGLFNTHPESIDSFLAFKDKSVQDLERSAVLKAHALRVMQTVDKCITRLDKPDKMSALLYQLGKRHVDYQANIKLIPIIGKQFVGAIEPKMGANWSREIKASWEGLFTIINYSMRQGLMDEKNSRIRAARDDEALRKKIEEKRRREKKT